MEYFIKQNNWYTHNVFKKGHKCSSCFHVQSDIQIATFTSEADATEYLKWKNENAKGSN